MWRSARHLSPSPLPTHRSFCTRILNMFLMFTSAKDGSLSKMEVSDMYAHGSKRGPKKHPDKDVEGAGSSTEALLDSFMWSGDRGEVLAFHDYLKSIMSFVMEEYGDEEEVEVSGSGSGKFVSAAAAAACPAPC